VYSKLLEWSQQSQVKFIIAKSTEKTRCTDLHFKPGCHVTNGCYLWLAIESTFMAVKCVTRITIKPHKHTKYSKFHLDKTYKRVLTLIWWKH